MKKTLIILFLTVLVSSLAIAQTDKNSKQSDKELQAVDTTQINWVKYDEGLQMAKETGKKIFINFTTAWCGYCKKMIRDVFSKPDAIKLLNGSYIPIKVDGDSKDELNIDGYKITERNLTKSEYRVSGYPTYWILKPNAERITTFSGYRPKETFINMISFIKDDAYEKMSFDEYLKNGGSGGDKN